MEAPNKYANGKIYRLYSKSKPDLVYYGSTITSLSQRLSCHKSHYKSRDKGTNNRSANAIIEIGDPIIELIEKYPCNKQCELNKREGYYIRNNECINKFIAGREKKETNQQFYEKHPNYTTEKSREYRKLHPNYYKVWYHQNKERLAQKRYDKIDKEYQKNITASRIVTASLSNDPSPSQSYPSALETASDYESE
jgi:hypothetical protein